MPRSANPKTKQEVKKKVVNKNQNAMTQYFKKNYNKPYRFPGAGSALGRVAGSYIGSKVPFLDAQIGRSLGSVVGKGAHSLVKTVTGFGDYRVKGNSLVYNIDAVPEFSDSDRCTIVTHREFIADVKGSINFNIQEYRINPAISSTFPWLASLAANYEQYVIQGMLFEFKTTSATAIGSTNTALGTVILATQYNSLSPNFINKQQMENYEFSQSCAPCESVLHPIECDPHQTQCNGIFNMYNPDNAAGDVRLYDIGRFNIATVGMQRANVDIGELWVTYKICLLKPRLQGVVYVSDGYVLNSSYINSTYPLSTQQIPYSGNSNFTSITGANFNTIQFDPSFTGLVMITVVYSLSAITGYALAPQIVPVNSQVVGQSIQYLGQVEGSLPGYIDNLTYANCMYACGVVQINGGFDSAGNPPQVTISGMTANPANTYTPNVCRLLITTLNPSFKF